MCDCVLICVLWQYACLLALGGLRQEEHQAKDYLRNKIKPNNQKDYIETSKSLSDPRPQSSAWEIVLPALCL